MQTEVERYDAIVDSYHVDVSDGTLVNNLLFAPMHVAALRSVTNKPVVIHLMVESPREWLRPFAEAGASVIAVHTTASDVEGTVDAILSTGAAPAIALSLAQPYEPFVHVFAQLAHVVVLGTPLGVKGATLDRRALTTVNGVKRIVDGTHVEVYVDGGIRHPTLAAIRAAGADGVVAGSILAGIGDPRPIALAIRGQ